VDLRLVVARLNAKPSIRIDSGSFVARYDGEEYLLCSVQIGLQAAIRQAMILKREDRKWRIRADATEPAIHNFLQIRERFQLSLDCD
jgi:hypothetical protein